jgi:hypothetical protein
MPRGLRVQEALEPTEQPIDRLDRQQILAAALHGAQHRQGWI